MATLQFGSKGEEVKRLQHILNYSLQPSPKLTEDGDFGKKTEDAVKRLQKQKGLVADGVVGPKTWTALDWSAPANLIHVV
jgi:peptidoglycan hydrolase-like protein with peptidoglycan-binding domain